MRRVLAVLLSLVLMATFTTNLIVTVLGAGDSIATATAISTGTNYSGSITETNTKDVYKFTLPSSGRINIKLNAYIYVTNYYLYDSDGNEVWRNTYQYWNDVSEMYSMDANIDLTKGTYYFAVEKYSGTGNYNFKINFKSSDESFVETLYGNNQEIKDSNLISLATSYKGQIAINDDKDVYKFTLSSSGRVNIKLSAYIYTTNYYLYDSDGNEVWRNTYQYWNDVSEMYSMDANIDLTKGTYYFAVEKYSGTGNYNFKINFKSADESFEETLYGNNQEIKDADTISLATSYKGQIATNDDKDVYKFTLPSSGRVNIKLSAYIYTTNYYLYDSDGNEVWRNTYQYWNDVSEMYSMDANIDLTKGTYYFAVEKYSGTGNYNFKINFKSSGESFVETLYGNNQDIKTADNITLGKTYKGQIAQNDNKDIYSFQLPKTMRVRLSLTAYVYCTNFYIYDKNGNTIWSKTYQYIDETSGKYSLKEDIDLSAGKYYFAIEERNGTGNYSFSIKLVTPKIKTISNTQSGVKIAWDKVSGATKYEVYRKVKGGSYSKVGTTSKTYFTDKKSKSGKTYYYTVKAVNEAGKSDSSSSKSIKFLADPTLKTPSSTKKGIVLKWNKITGAQGYMVYRKTGSGSYSKIATVKGSTKVTYTDKSAKKGKKYTYKVKAYYSKTYSAYSNTKTIKDKY